MVGLLLAAACGATPPTTPPPSAPAVTSASEPVDATDDLRSRCETGDGAACLSGADRHGPDGPDPSPTRRARFEQRACELGVPRGCARLADTFARGEPGFSRDPTQAARLWSMACDDGDAPACESAARAHHEGQGVVRDDKRAQGYLDRGCRLGARAQCAPLEEVFASTDAAGWLRRAFAAQLEAIRGCYNLALLADPAISGRIAVRFSTDASGAVATAEVGSNDTGDPELAECVEAVVAHARVPGPAPRSSAVTFLLIPSHAGPREDPGAAIVVQGGPTAPRPDPEGPASSH